MTDRLQQELLAVPGLEQVTALQLQELPWKTREQVFIALFQEHASSVAVAEELRVKSRDRRFERKTEKVENVERDVVRKSEERFRSEFMQVAANELSRLGAPAMITWQKLVFDRDCCAQAFRILLTKIKSAKRSNNNSNSSQSVRRPITLAKRFATPEAGQPRAEDDDWGDAEGSSEAASMVSADQQHGGDTVLPRIPNGVRSTTKPRGGPPQRLGKPGPSEWNADTRVADSFSRDEEEDERLESEARSLPFGSADISIQRTTVKPVVSASTSAFATKLKKSQLNSLQQENASLAGENAALRDEIAHLESVVATLQAEQNQVATSCDPQSAYQARMKLLQAQNMQLQRQIGLLQDAILERDMAESMLLTALSHWREVIQCGRDEAKAAGAEDQAKTKDGKPARWMLAVPDRLMEELVRVESQIEHAMKTMSLAHEAKLRVGGTAADFLKHSTSSAVAFSAIYVPGIAHLRVDRVKSLEASLTNTLRELEAMYDHIILSVAPTMASGISGGRLEKESGASAELDRLLASMRNVLVEVGAFGIVVPAVNRTPERLDPSENEAVVTVAQVLRAYTTVGAPASGVSAKDREKQLKVMLKQLQASESAAQRERNQLHKLATYWKDAWAMQEQLLRTLIQRVRNVGDKKMQWADSYLVHPLRELQEVWTSFQCTRNSQQDQRLHKNAYLPLLIDTLERHEPVVCLEAIDQWQQYATRYNHEISEIFADYDANCVMLKSYVAAGAS